MKKKWYAFGLAVILGIALCACEKTPDEKIVARKNNERLKEEAQKGADESNSLATVAKEADEHYSYEYTNDDKTLTVKADADVWLPEKDTIPMYEVSSTGFSQELVTKAYNYFFDGVETYRMEGTDATKEVFEDRILKCKEEKAKIEGDDSLSEEDREFKLQSIEDELQRLQEAYADAPEEPTTKKVPADSILRRDENTQTENPEDEIYGVNCQSDDAFFSVANFPVDSSGWSSLYYLRNTECTYYVDGDTNNKLDKERLAEIEKNIGISYQAALDEADDFFSELGVDAEMMASFALKGYMNPQSEEDVENSVWRPEEKESAYCFFYTKRVDGIPFAATFSNYIPDNETSVTWCYERITITVDKDGIVEVQWEFPSNVGENVSENVGIISFQDAKDVFEKMIPIIYEGEFEQYGSKKIEMDYNYIIEGIEDNGAPLKIDVNVDQVKLSLMRVRDSGGERTGVMAPAWVFYGTETRKYHAYDDGNSTGEGNDYTSTEPEPWIVLAVNAVDGSVIDVTEGY